MSISEYIAGIANDPLGGNDGLTPASEIVLIAYNLAIHGCCDQCIADACGVPVDDLWEVISDLNLRSGWEPERG